MAVTTTRDGNWTIHKGTEAEILAELVSDQTPMTNIAGFTSDGTEFAVLIHN